ncbi:Restriction modification system DNA specificity protein, partial [human gut metagenome]
GKRPKGGAIESGIPSLGGEHIDNFGGLIISDSKMKYVPQDYYEKLNKGISKFISINSFEIPPTVAPLKSFNISF